jgi:hypothetical protein
MNIKRVLLILALIALAFLARAIVEAVSDEREGEG